MRKLLLVFTLLLVFSCKKEKDEPLPVVTGPEVSGRVMDERNDKPLPNTEVYVFCTAINQEAFMELMLLGPVMTDDSGRYKIVFNDNELFAMDDPANYEYEVFAFSETHTSKEAEKVTFTGKSSVVLDLRVTPFAFLHFRIKGNKGNYKMNLKVKDEYFGGYYAGTDTSRTFKLIGPSVAMGYVIIPTSSMQNSTSYYDTLALSPTDTTHYLVEF